MFNFKKLILIIDDDDDFAKGVADVLEFHGIDSLIANNSQQAMNILNSNSGVSTILSDIKLDNETGIDILQKIKKYREDLPVIMITAYPDVESAIKSVKLNAYDYLQKPYDPQHMVEIISKALELSKSIINRENSKNELIQKVKELRAM